ncbi:MAG: recombinase family protein, partial [Planctomycetes bacterium]|nr:recombinase family protein [Planctomycetota bacterium]
MRVLLPGRISTPEQDIQSIDSQYLDDETWLRENYRGPVDIRHFGEQASGWLADRGTMQQVERIIEAGGCDAVVVSELREIYRNPAFHWKFAHLCVDNEVRLISIADAVDTAQDDWETHMHIASLRAGLAVPEIRRRVRRKATYSFEQGGMVLKVRFGYRKLSKEEAASGQFGTPGLRIAKLPEWTPI